MKKIICLLSILLLVSCSTNSKDSLSIVVPSGAPSLAFYNQVDNSNFYTSSAQNIVSQMFSNNGEDIIVLDTINGIRAINKKADYKLAATITFGNFYIASTGLDENKTMDKDDYIVLFSQNATPDIIFHNIYGNSFDENIHYVDAVSDALACLLKGINISDDNMSINEKYVDYVMIAEPALQIALAQNKDAYIYQNLQDLYYEKNNSKMIQASIFVSNRLDKKTIDDYLDKIKNNIDTLLNEPQAFETYILENNISEDEVKDVFGIANSKIVAKILKDNSIGLDFKMAYDIKDDINNFVKMFNEETLSEEDYYK